MTFEECGNCTNSFPDFYIENGVCPKCAGFTDAELSDDLKEIYYNIDEQAYMDATDPCPVRLWPEVEMN